MTEYRIRCKFVTSKKLKFDDPTQMLKELLKNDKELVEIKVTKYNTKSYKNLNNLIVNSTNNKKGF